MDGRELLMAIDKAIDSTLLDANLTLIANAVRAKSGASAQLAFPDGFVAAINGISGGSYAYIVVSFPAGTSSCTCSNGTVTLTADASALAKGLYVFAIPSAGTWTVAASSGTESKTQSVSITAEGQAESVKMSFWDGTLYDAGNQYTDITGGWERVGTGGKVTFNDDNMEITCTTDNSFGTVQTANAIDLTGFASVKVTISAADKRNMGGSIRIINPITNAIVASSALDSTALTTTTALDISSINEQCYVRILATYTYPYNHTFNITKVIMEAAT